MNATYQNTALATVPNSLKTQLERAQNLLAQSERAESHGDHALATMKAKEGMRVLRIVAQHSPDMAALIMAGEMGFRGIRMRETERIDRYQVVDRTFLGFVVGHDVVNVPTITTRMRELSLF